MELAQELEPVERLEQEAEEALVLVLVLALELAPQSDWARSGVCLLRCGYLVCLARLVQR